MMDLLSKVLKVSELNEAKCSYQMVISSGGKTYEIKGESSTDEK